MQESSPDRDYLRPRRSEMAWNAVLHPAAFRIEHLREFGDRMESLPFPLRIAAVDGFGPVELRRAVRDGIAVQVPDVARAVRVDGVGAHQRPACESGLEFSQI